MDEVVVCGASLYVQYAWGECPSPRGRCSMFNIHVCVAPDTPRRTQTQLPFFPRGSLHTSLAFRARLRMLKLCLAYPREIYHSCGYDSLQRLGRNEAEIGTNRRARVDTLQNTPKEMQQRPTSGVRWGRRRGGGEQNVRGSEEGCENGEQGGENFDRQVVCPGSLAAVGQWCCRVHKMYVPYEKRSRADWLVCGQPIKREEKGKKEKSAVNTSRSSTLEENERDWPRLRLTAGRQIRPRPQTTRV